MQNPTLESRTNRLKRAFLPYYLRPTIPAAQFEIAPRHTALPFQQRTQVRRSLTGGLDRAGLVRA